MASLMSVLSRFRSIIRQNGGIRGSIVTLFRTDELKDGTLVGEDYLGNKYYENNRYFVGRNRHRWLHYMTDQTPITHPPDRKPWMQDHKENTTLQPDAKYIPFPTVKPKIEAWNPKHVNLFASCH
ncbi:NADH dehydrogenase 1 alpha subcomplex subunit 12 ndufa12/DAP13 [Sparganum proliferum]